MSTVVEWRNTNLMIDWLMIDKCFGDLPKITNFMALWILTQEHMGLEISKPYSYSLDPIWAKLNDQ